jgi:hypothetical protein
MAKSGDKKPKKKTTRKPSKKGVWDGGQNIWTHLSGPVLSGGGYDRPVPTSYDLISAFNDVVYSCVNLIAPNVAKDCDKYRLVVSTGPRDPSPKSATKSLQPHEINRIGKAYPTYSRRAVRVDEVVDHGVLDLLDCPNPDMSFRTLVEWVVGYLEIVGSAFVVKSGLNVGSRKVVTALWVLPSQHVYLDVDPRTGQLLGYKYRSGETEYYYDPDEVIHFRRKNYMDPSGLGVSPVRAVWERIQLLDKEQLSWDSVLNNMTFPTTLVRPPADIESWTPQQTERIEKQLWEKGRYGNQGGVWALPEAMDVQQLSSPPKDLSALQLYEAIRKSVATAMNIPTPMLDLSDTSSEAADTVRRNFQQYCLSWRVEDILEVLSHPSVPAPHVVGG